MKDTKKKAVVESPKITKAYKAFNNDWKCNNFQYEVGKSYEHKGDLKICASGFHACVEPLDVLQYYPLVGSKFAEVEFTGDTVGEGNDSKIAGKHIKIKAELSVGFFIKASVDMVFNGWFKDVMKKAKNKEEGVLAQSAQSGSYSQSAQSGSYSKSAQSGDNSQSAQSGYNSKSAQSGSYSQSAQSGDNSQSAQSGSYSKSAQSGYNSAIELNGTFSVGACVHGRSRIKGIIGALICLVHYDKDGKPLKFVTGEIGKKRLKADTWYMVGDDGKFKEWK